MWGSRAWPACRPRPCSSTPPRAFSRPDHPGRVRILFDQGTPVPLKEFFPGHGVATAYERGWSTLSNGELLARAETEFELLVTTDRNLRNQQNMGGRRPAVLVLPTTNWLRLRSAGAEIAAFALAIRPGDFKEFRLPPG